MAFRRISKALNSFLSTGHGRVQHPYSPEGGKGVLWDQVTTIGAQTSPTVKQPPHDVMYISAKAPEAGYAFVFVSNEHFNYVDVYFDDVSVCHTPSPIVNSSDYFPYGLSYNSMERTGSLEQKYLYNGKELQDEMALNWYDYGARMYMPEIGRWG